jgi:hypothetical protein
VREDWGYIKNNNWYFIPQIKSRLHEFNCFYRLIHRINDAKIYKENWRPLSDATPIPDEVFEVKCVRHGSNNQIDYHNLFVQFMSKKNLLNGRNLISRSLKKCKPLNIMLISYDSVSRVSWKKRLNKTNKFIFDIMKFELLEGYNIIGDGTPGKLTILFINFI